MQNTRLFKIYRLVISTVFLMGLFAATVFFTGNKFSVSAKIYSGKTVTMGGQPGCDCTYTTYNQCGCITKE
jgi:hypothetical protein